MHGSGELDITSDVQSLDGLAEELDHFPDKRQLLSILDSGTNPDSFLAEYDGKLQRAEVKAITDYIEESDNLVELNTNIEKCDNLLETLESILQKYEDSLGHVGSDIAALQRKSDILRGKLENRKKVEDELGSFIQRIALLPSLIEAIMTSPVTEDEFVVNVMELRRKLEYVQSDENIRQSAAFRDVAIEMERLRLGAVRRCRDFFVSRILEMRKSSSNIQMQQNVLLRYRELLAFLNKHGNAMYLEVRSSYSAAVGAKFLEVFKIYWAYIEQMEKSIVPQDLLLGTPVAVTSPGISNMMSLLSLGKAKGNDVDTDLSQNEIFDLHDRMKVLLAVEDSPLIPSKIQEIGKQPFEFIFLSISKLLVDTASHEYLFSNSFWRNEGRIMFKDVFQQVLDFVHGSLQAVLQELNDPVAILLCICINREHFLLMSRKRNPALDDYFDAINLMLWPRVKAILDRHLDSLENCQHIDTDIIPSKILPVTRRYTSLAASVIILNSKLVDGSLALNIERLKYAVMNLLLVTSREQFSVRGKGTVFLMHNFHYVISTLKTKISDCENSLRLQNNGDSGLTPLGNDVISSFEEAFSRALDLYVDSRITAGAPQVVSFVRKGEALIAREEIGLDASAGIDLVAAGHVAKDFSIRWKNVVSVLNREVKEDFRVKTLQDLVQKTTHSKLLLLWSRFLEVVKNLGDAGGDLVSRSVSIPTIMYELKGGTR
eukprot:jgi/Picsp_1/8/NSC_00008-R1_vacuolar protein sorting-associated protein 52 homolog